MKALILCDGYGKKQSINDGSSNALTVLTKGLTVVDKLLLDLATVGLREAVLLNTVSSRQLQETLGNVCKGIKLSFEHAPRTFHDITSVSYTHLRAHETKANIVCRLLLEKKKQRPEVVDKKERLGDLKIDLVIEKKHR